MPLDRRRSAGLLAWLLSPLPWAWQERIPDRSLRRLVLLLLGLTLLGPWALAVIPLWSGIRAVVAEARALARWQRRVGTDWKERAIWAVRVSARWRWGLLRRLGVLWLPAPAPLAEGDIVLFDLREVQREPLEAPSYYLAGRVGALGAAFPRRRRRVVRLASLWTLEVRVPLIELHETYRVERARPGPESLPLVRAIEPTDEDRLVHRHRLLAKVAVREERKPGWREERKVRELFHKLWGMAHDSDNYDKQSWGSLQADLKELGVWV